MNETAGLSTRSALLSGIVFGAAWYVGAQTILDTAAPSLASVPVWGGLFFAAGIPAFLMRYLPSGRDRFAAFDLLDDEVWVIQRTSGRVMFQNSSAVRHMGRGKGAAASRTVWNIWPYEYHAILNAILSQLGAEEETPVQVGERHLLPVANFLEGDEHVMLVLRDVSEEVEQRWLTEECVATVSHELRSPLTSIKGSMGLLLSKGADELPEPARKLVGVAHRNAERMALMLNDILDTQKIAEGRMTIESKEFDLAELIHSVIDASALFFQRFDLTIDLVGADVPLLVSSDAKRIMQVMDNLLTNAAKFSKMGGRITVKLKSSAYGVTILVQDEGIGIPSRDHGKIFERFADMSNSNRDKNGGSGLGLSICKAIIDSLGGRIEFESAEGVGTVFQVSLPKGNGQASPIHADENMQNAG